MVALKCISKAPRDRDSDSDLDSCRRDAPGRVKHLCEGEFEMTKLVNLPGLLSDPRNRCTRLLETLYVPFERNTVILAMPLLRPWDEPPLRTVGEVVHFLGQIFEVSRMQYVWPSVT